MPVIVLTFVAVLIGFVVIALNKQPPAYLPMEGHGHPSLGDDAELLQGLSFEQFEQLCLALIQHMGLELESVERVESDEVEIRARDGKPVVGGKYILIGVWRPGGELVAPPSVSNLYSVVKDEHAAGGILVTNSLFAVPAANMLEAERLQLMNGAALLDAVGRDAVPLH